MTLRTEITTIVDLTRVTRTLANTALDLQIAICIFLRPIDILALRKTCKALELTTRQRVVWVAALHRVCLDNTLFLPTFPILDMSDLELEQAAMAPHRWIELCGGFKKRDPDYYFGEKLCLRTTRIIRDDDVTMESVPNIFLVPGGRYLVVATIKRLLVWDLGYVSNTHCTLIASVGLAGGSRYGLICMVQVTPDNMGLIILVSNTRGSDSYISIYEIYPQSKTPVLTQIANSNWGIYESPVYLLPDTLLVRHYYTDRAVFRSWDYRANCSTCFSVDKGDDIGTFATKTAIINFYEEGILVWAIPPLLPHSPDHFLDDNPTHLPPLFRIPFPDGIVYNNIYDFRTISSWYFGSWESIYFGIFHSDSESFRLDRFKLIVKPDHSEASLHAINTSFDYECVSRQISSRICEDTCVTLWSSFINQKCVVYAGLVSAHFTCDIAIKDWMPRLSRSLCPASGKFVYFTCDDDDCRVVVIDLI